MKYHSKRQTLARTISCSLIYFNANKPCISLLILERNDNRLCEHSLQIAHVSGWFVHFNKLPRNDNSLSASLFPSCSLSFSSFVSTLGRDLEISCCHLAHLRLICNQAHLKHRIYSSIIARLFSLLLGATSQPLKTSFCLLLV